MPASILRPLLLLLVLAVAGAGEVLPTACFANLRDGKAQVIVLYGTSLTHGGEWAVATKAWFAERFPGKATVINSAGPGQNSQWGLANLDERVLAHQPDLVLMEFSYNDAHEKFNLTVAQAAANLEAMVRGIRAKRPSCDIVLQVMNANWDAPNGKRTMSARPQLAAFNDNYRACAKAHALPLLDHFPAWLALKEKDRELFERYVPDGTHPTKEGSLAVTWPAVKGMLERAAQAASR